MSIVYGIAGNELVVSSEADSFEVLPYRRLVLFLVVFFLIFN